MALRPRGFTNKKKMYQATVVGELGSGYRYFEVRREHILLRQSKCGENTFCTKPLSFENWAPDIDILSLLVLNSVTSTPQWIRAQYECRSRGLTKQCYRIMCNTTYIILYVYYLATDLVFEKKNIFQGLYAKCERHPRGQGVASVLLVCC